MAHGECGESVHTVSVGRVCGSETHTNSMAATQYTQTKQGSSSLELQSRALVYIMYSRTTL